MHFNWKRRRGSSCLGWLLGLLGTLFFFFSHSRSYGWRVLLVIPFFSYRLRFLCRYPALFLLSPPTLRTAKPVIFLVHQNITSPPLLLRHILLPSFPHPLLSTLVHHPSSFSFTVPVELVSAEISLNRSSFLSFFIYNLISTVVNSVHIDAFTFFMIYFFFHWV